MKNIIKNCLLLMVVMFMSSCGYNSMVNLDEKVQGQWADVEAAYQRRADLIPNLVKTVKGLADFERGTLEAVVNARASATKVEIDPSNLTAENMKQFEAAQGKVSGALSRLLLTFERYPELKADKGFLELQAQLEGTENRISVERQKFNETVEGYNTMVRSFPQAAYAGMLGFDKKAYFESKEGADEAPDVEF